MRTEFRYDPITCRYEPVVASAKTIFRQTILFFIASLMTGLGGLIYYNSRYEPWDQLQLKKTHVALKTQWEILNEELTQVSGRLATLEDNDDNNYRSILDLGPLPASIREAGVGGREKAFSTIGYTYIKSAMEKAEKLKNRLDIESQSLAALDKELAEKEKMWASRPAIQPISNENLIHLHTTYGLRMHPILGFFRDHKGLDFTAPEGSPIYATGDGVVEYADGGTTYGNVVFINHGYHFQTRYAHMIRFNVSVGEHVRRGQVIGFVGNTGQSFGNHCHYEVLVDGDHVNPINFFQRDLSNREYEKLISVDGNSKASLD